MKKKTKKTSKRARSAEHDTPDDDTGSEASGEESAATGRRPSVNYEEFVRKWKDSDTIADVAAHFGIARTSATAIASRLRKKGVELPKFARNGAQEIDVKALNRILKSG